MREWSPSAAEVVRDLMIGNRIVANEGVLDAFGHLSARHPEDPNRYLMTRPMAPDQVTEEDIMELDLDSRPIEPGRKAIVERFIHGGIYKARPDVMAVCHSHTPSIIPFGVTGNSVRPICHTGGAIGQITPIWDIREDFGDGTDLLVDNADKGRSLATALGRQRVCLMRGHGSVVGTHDIKAAVMVSIWLMNNAALQMQAQAMGPVNYLSQKEVEAMEALFFGERTIGRAWGFYCRRAGFDVNPDR
jgi:ribulose-5-phosphate 4-epimerase/fuculose-1-phosphate aldolase